MSFPGIFERLVDAGIESSDITDAHPRADVHSHAVNDSAGTDVMKYIALVTMAALLLLQWTDSIPQGSVGGSLVIGWILLAAAIGVGIHEAWTRKRGAVGWIVSIVVAFLGAVVAAPAGGAVMGIVLSAFATGRSLAATGGPILSLALAGMTAIVLLCAWGALRIVDRWR